jgi:dolichyl-diphosphooligosaccharide--protein glycosyltransferase
MRGRLRPSGGGEQGLPVSAKLRSKANVAAKGIVREPQGSTGKVNFPSFFIPIIILLVGLMSSCVIHYSHLGSWNAVRSLYYYDNDLPLLLAADGYYYLRLSSDLATGGYHERDELRPGQPRPYPAPLLAVITAAVHQITHLPLEKIAFYLPPVLGLLMVPVYLLWGYAISGALVALYSLLAGISSPSWYGSTCLGKFDTEILNPVLAYLILLTMYKYITLPSRNRYMYLLASILLSAIFGLWWDNARYLGIFLVVCVYCLSIFLPSSRPERIVKAVLIMVLGVLGMAVPFGLDSWFPAPLSRPLHTVSYYLSLSMKTTGAEFPDVGESIKELRAYSPKEFVFFAGGSWAAVLLSSVGLAVLFRRNRAAGLSLLPGLALGLGALLSRRYLIFFVPLYALGLGYFLGEVFSNSALVRKWLKKPVALGASLVLCAILLIPAFSHCFTKTIIPRFTAAAVSLARSLQTETPPQTAVWAHWDEGFFLQYFGRRRTFIDGSMQGPQRFFVSTYPLRCDNPVLAANWMRFFSANDMDGFYALRKVLGGTERALAFLKRVLSDPDQAEKYLIDFGLDPNEWRSRLFPGSPSASLLTPDLLGKSYWWFYGSWNVTEQSGRHLSIGQVDSRFGSPQDKGTKGIIGAYRYGMIYDVDSSGVRVEEVDSQADYVLIRTKGQPQSYLVEKEFMRSLVGRLLYADPKGTEPFRAILYQPLIGGVWAVD